MAPVLSNVSLVAAATTRVRFIVQTEPGRTYQVEFKEVLAAGGWTPLGGPHVASGPTLVIEDTTTAGQRFYRVTSP